MAQKRKRNQTKQKEKRQADSAPKIAKAALVLAATHGWENLTMAQIAKEAGITPDTAQKRFPDIASVILWILEHLHQEVETAVDGYLGADWRDNLMEILMMRFELAQNYREAYAALPSFFRRHPAKLRHAARPYFKTMSKMLALAKLPERPLPARNVATLSLGVLYATLLDTWMRDDTPDMSKTMAAIDKRLDLFEQALDFSPCKK